MTDSLNEWGFSEAVSIAFQTESWPSRWRKAIFTSKPSGHKWEDPGQRKGACPQPRMYPHKPHRLSQAQHLIHFPYTQTNKHTCLISVIRTGPTQLI